MILDDVKKFQDIVEKEYSSAENKARRKKQTRFLKYYTGKYWIEQEQDYTEGPTKPTPVFCNFIFSTIQTIAPLLTCGPGPRVRRIRIGKPMQELQGEPDEFERMTRVTENRAILLPRLVLVIQELDEIVLPQIGELAMINVAIQNMADRLQAGIKPPHQQRRSEWLETDHPPR